MINLIISAKEGLILVNCMPPNEERMVKTAHTVRKCQNVTLVEAGAKQKLKDLYKLRMDIDTEGYHLHVVKAALDRQLRGIIPGLEIMALKQQMAE